MAVLRDQPYLHFNFLVDFGTGSSDGPEAGFAEVSGIGMEPTQCEPHNRRETSVTKILGVSTCTEVTFKRGVIRLRSLHDWLIQTQTSGPAADRTVTVRLQNGDHTRIVLTWKLHRARIIKFTGPVNAKDTHVAMEELVLACEHLERQ